MSSAITTLSRRTEVIGPSGETMPERDEILVKAFSHIFLLRLCQEGLRVVELAFKNSQLLRQEQLDPLPARLLP